MATRTTSLKSCNAHHPHPTIHHFAAEICPFLLQNGALWDIYLSNASWDLWDGFIEHSLITLFCVRVVVLPIIQTAVNEDIFSSDTYRVAYTAIVRYFTILLPLASILAIGNAWKYHQTSNIRRNLVGNKIADYSDVVGASPVGAAPTTYSFSA